MTQTSQLSFVDQQRKIWQTKKDNLYLFLRDYTEDLKKKNPPDEIKFQDINQEGTLGEHREHEDSCEIHVNKKRDDNLLTVTKILPDETKHEKLEGVTLQSYFRGEKHDGRFVLTQSPNSLIHILFYPPYREFVGDGKPNPVIHWKSFEPQSLTEKKLLKALNAWWAFCRDLRNYGRPKTLRSWWLFIKSNKFYLGIALGVIGSFATSLFLELFKALLCYSLWDFMLSNSNYLLFFVGLGAVIGALGFIKKSIGY